MAGETLKKYVGIAGDALADVWQRLRGEDYGPEATPPIGSQDRYPAGGYLPPTTAGIAGISTGTLLLFGVLWVLMKGKGKRGIL